ncbi:MAG: hypothetical protein GQ574_08755 [Crocinitomix sp.]|nr:hypothetical protein [Crocinitomix sp.]
MSNVKEHTIIKNKNSTGELLADDIVHIFYKGDTYLEIEDFKEGIQTYITFAQGQKLKILVEIGKFAGASAEARKFAQDNNPEALAEAIIIHSLAQRVLAKFYIIFHHSDHPVRVFVDKEKGIEWLNSI